MKRRSEVAEPTVGMAELTAALDTILELGPGRLDDEVVAATERLRAQVTDRFARGEGATVAAVAGGTGVGKSALVNALLGRSVATEGVRRPTTQVALAAARELHGPETALLDWLEVPERHAVGAGLPDGLVLMDVPDHDSVVEQHRRTAARLAQRVDVVVWVLDPVKYARADAHEGPLAALTAHAEVLVVVLNRIDELPAGEVDGVLADLHARLAAGGHRDATVVPTSAVTGEGIDELRATLVDLAAARSAATARLAGDAVVLGGRLADGLEELPALDIGTDTWLPGLLEAVDAYRAAAEAGGLARRDTLRRARSPISRAVAAPLRGTLAAFRGGPAVAGAGSAPTRATVTDRIRAIASDHLGLAAATGRTHLALDRAIAVASDSAAPALLDAVAGAGLAPPPRRWPTALAAARGVAEAVAFGGAAWLTALALVAWLQLPSLPAPDAIGAVPWPTALLFGGLLVRILLGLTTRGLARIAARRHGARVARRIERSVRDVAHDRLLADLRAEVEAQDRLRAAVTVLARPRADRPLPASSRAGRT